MKSNPLEKKIEALEAELIKAKDELSEAQSARMRVLADLQNFQRREAQNKMSWVEVGIAEFLKNMLPKFLELKLGSEHSADKDIQKTVERFFSELEKQGLETLVPSVGDIIDPQIHEVLMAEEGTPGTVVRVLEPGWKFQSIILRPAKISGAQHS
ncbi:nucleotide exchange factor GrpE [Candidatus Gracilibacteria bacterium]|nr:nucleotide exchange factor GrpE [Candidatus Gracilibacteria bacterium]